MTDRQFFSAAGALIGLAILVSFIGALCSCSPVNVQVQQCEHVVKNSHGFTFTGCKVDGDQKNEPSGTLEVKIPLPAEDPDGPASQIPASPFGRSPPPPNIAKMN